MSFSFNNPLYIGDKDAAVKSDIAELQSEVGDLSQLETGDKSSLVNALNEAMDSTLNGVNRDLTNLSDDGINELHTLTRPITAYANEGELLTDAEGLADVKNYAHSTFDLSKFTIVGSPNITDDGIASGFSNNGTTPQNYITFPANTFRPGSKPWKIKCEASFASTLASEALYGINFLSGSIYGALLKTNTDGSASFQVYNSIEGGNITTGSTAVGIIQPNGTHTFILEFTGSAYKCYIDDSLVKEVSSNATVYQDNTALNIIGARNSIDQHFTGSINLKQFSITVDGVEVFSGNKTGIDTYTIGGETVTIPYTLSSRDDKIVDSAYRTQVTAVYNYQGYAPYFTLSDSDFTLPMGDLYGFIALANAYADYSSGVTVSDINGSGKAYTVQNKGLAIIKPTTPAATYTISVNGTSVGGYGYMTLPLKTGDIIYTDVAASMNIYKA